MYSYAIGKYSKANFKYYKSQKLQPHNKRNTNNFYHIYMDRLTEK